MYRFAKGTGDDDDAVEFTCTNCGTTGQILLHVEDGHWWWRWCCDTAGIGWAW